MRIPLIAGNWKMHKTVAEARDLAEGVLRGLGELQSREVVICPPFTALHALSSLIKDTPLGLGAQDVFSEPHGAYTGAISALMLRDLGCHYVIIGHSERRQIFGEDDALVNRKMHAALSHGLRTILCVGETLEQREAGQADRVVVGQVTAGLAGIEAARLSHVVIAYEPIWAIGTGKTATPADAQQMHATIRATLVELYDMSHADQLRIQYGGSVKPENIDGLMAQPDIDGALVGGASLTAHSFLRLVHFQ